MMERLRVRLVQEILEPARLPARVRHPDHETQFPCNKVGEPRQAWPTLVAHNQAKGFKMEGGREGPGMVFDRLKGIWEEPTALERELAMGFMARATASGDVTERQRKRALGNAMDLNALHWLVAYMAALSVTEAAEAEETAEAEARVATAAAGAEERANPPDGVEGIGQVPTAGGEGHRTEGENETRHSQDLGTAIQGAPVVRLEEVLRQHAAAFAHSLQELGKCVTSTINLPLTIVIGLCSRDTGSGKDRPVRGGTITEDVWGLHGVKQGHGNQSVPDAHGGGEIRSAAGQLGVLDIRPEAGLLDSHSRGRQEEDCLPPARRLVRMELHAVRTKERVVSECYIAYIV
ncbi:unnamed protein product [Closterium sp. NIES-54]